MCAGAEQNGSARMDDLFVAYGIMHVERKMITHGEETCRYHNRTVGADTKKGSLDHATKLSHHV